MTRSPLNDFFKYRDKKAKVQAIYKARLHYGYTLKDITEYIGVHYTTVSRAVKKNWRGEMKSDIARSDPIIYAIIYVHEAFFFDKKSKSGSEWVFMNLCSTYAAGSGSCIIRNIRGQVLQKYKGSGLEI